MSFVVRFILVTCWEIYKAQHMTLLSRLQFLRSRCLAVTRWRLLLESHLTIVSSSTTHMHNMRVENKINCSFEMDLRLKHVCFAGINICLLQRSFFRFSFLYFSFTLAVANSHFAFQQPFCMLSLAFLFLCSAAGKVYTPFLPHCVDSPACTYVGMCWCLPALWNVTNPYFILKSRIVLWSEENPTCVWCDGYF